MKAKIERLRLGMEVASNAIYAYAEHGHMPWSECYARAPEACRAAFDRAERAYRDAQADAVAKGSAYRGAFGLLVWRR